VTIWRDWLTDTVVAGLELDERQRKAIMLLNCQNRISNSEYRAFMGVSKPTASKDLDTLLTKGVLEKIGTTGKGTHYILSRKGLIKGSQGSRRNRATVYEGAAELTRYLVLCRLVINPL